MIDVDVDAVVSLGPRDVARLCLRMPPTHAVVARGGGCSWRVRHFPDVGADVKPGAGDGTDLVTGVLLRRRAGAQVARWWWGR